MGSDCAVSRARKPTVASRSILHKCRFRIPSGNFQRVRVLYPRESVLGLSHWCRFQQHFGLSQSSDLRLVPFTVTASDPFYFASNSIALYESK